MKVGDRLICHTSYGIYKKVFIKDKSYNITKIVEVNDITRFWIISDYNIEYGFSHEGYNKYFLDIKEQRKLKLEKLNNVYL